MVGGLNVSLQLIIINNLSGLNDWRICHQREASLENDILIKK